MKKLIALLSAFVLASCASIIHGSTQSITFDSQPVGVQARIDGQQTITTPAILSLARDKPHIIVFSKPDFMDQSVSLDPKISGWIFGNLVFGPLFGLVGVIVDFSNGAAYSLNEDRAFAALAPKACRTEK